MRWAVLAYLASAAPSLACFVPPQTNAIPGSLTENGADIGPREAWYEAPTDAYGHGIMGRVPDAQRLTVHSSTALNNCGTLMVDAGKAHVFEDTEPRLADIDGDGLAEVVAVRSSLSQGAQLVIYQDAGNGADLRILAATPYIGKRNRWLAPAAIGDLDGDGHVEIAYVDRPHLAKTLRIWRYAGGDFREVVSAGGLTNHAIGDEVIHGGLRDCGQGPEIVLSDANRNRMLAVTYDGDAIRGRDIGPWSSDAATSAMACRW